jgi:sugar phosphate isomerase/epimerase
MPLTYCLNVHPGETWDENLTTLRTTVLGVRDRVCKDTPFGLGLRLGAAAAATLDDRGRLAELREFLESENLHVFTVNAFPFGRFHGGPVKEQVYAPDWRSPERRDYTNQVANILAALLPDGGTGSISTVPLSWKGWTHGTAGMDAMLDHLADCVVWCAGLAAGSGREIVLALEPEPGCLLETTSETINFFNRHVFTQGAAAVAAKLGVTRTFAEARIREHLGVCLDTCHAAVEFEDPHECLKQYEAEGIRVGKIQISSALRTDASPEALEALKAFVEPVYLHQVKARMADGTIAGWDDLPRALEELPGLGAQEVRVHFHVPLHFGGAGVIQSTGAMVTPELLTYIRRDPSAHLEIETYTWDVLPRGVKDDRIEDSIAEEFRWVARK